LLFLVLNRTCPEIIRQAGVFHLQTFRFSPIHNPTII
jgi:hypothetical protein